MKPINANLEVLRLDHVGIRVSDIEISIKFYQLLGFFEDPNEYYPEFKTTGMVNEYGLYLYLIDGAEQSSVSQFNILMDANLKFPGLTHLALVINNITDAIDFFHSHQISITEGPLEFERRKVFFIRDPDGNVIEFDQLI